MRISDWSSDVCSSDLSGTEIDDAFHGFSWVMGVVERQASCPLFDIEIGYGGERRHAIGHQRQPVRGRSRGKPQNERRHDVTGRTQIRADSDRLMCFGGTKVQPTYRREQFHPPLAVTRLVR